MGDNTTLDTSLSLGTFTSITLSSYGNRNRKKPRKQKHPVSSFYPPVTKTISSKLQPGCLILIDKRTELYDMFRKANWEPILYYSNKNVLPDMVTYFYNNLEVRHGSENLVYLTSMVNKKPILLDHEELGKALKLSSNHLKLAKIDITKDFVYNKNELKLYLSVLCGLEIPQDTFNENVGISYEHFTPDFQHLALIMRGNILPSTSDSKLMSFAEIKLMYKLAGHKINFNLPYVILLQMISGFKKGYMLYGLFLTKVFEYFKLNVTALPYFQVTSTISDRSPRIVVPIAGFGTIPPPVIDLDSPSLPTASAQPARFDSQLAKLQADHDKLAESFKVLQDEFDKLVVKFKLTEARVEVLVNILGGTISRAGRIENSLNQLINFQLGFMDLPLLPLVEEIANEIPVMAQPDEGNVTGSGVSEMETDVINGLDSQNTGMESLD